MLHSNEYRSGSSVFIDRFLARTTALLVVCLAFTFWAERAAAEETLPLVVAKFEGKRPDEVRTQVIKTLRAGGYLVADDDVTPSIDPSADSAAFVSLAEDGGFRGFVLATTEKKKGWKTLLTIREGRTGDVVGEVTLVGGWFPGLLKKIDTNLILEGKASLDKTRGPNLSEYQQVAEEPPPKSEEVDQAAEEKQADEPPPEEKPQESASEAKEDKPFPGSDIERRKNKDPALDLQVGGMWMQRNWELTDIVNGPGGSQVLSAHDVPLTGFRVAMEIYPVAFFNNSAARHIGIEAMMARSLLASTEYPGAEGDEKNATVFLDLTFGLRGRIPLGSTFLGIFGGVGAGQLNVARDSGTIPHSDANYRFYRAGADYWLPLGKIAEAKVSMAYRGVLSLGDGENEIQSAEWFPDATGGALEGRLQFGFFLARNWSIRVGATAQRYGFDFNQSPGTVANAAAAGDPEPALAAGASDTYWGADVGIALLLF